MPTYHRAKLKRGALYCSLDTERPSHPPGSNAQSEAVAATATTQSAVGPAATAADAAEASTDPSDQAISETASSLITGTGVLSGVEFFRRVAPHAATLLLHEVDCAVANWTAWLLPVVQKNR